MTTVEILHAAGMPTKSIAAQLGLTYRKVYDYLIYCHLRPIPLPPRERCSRGHDLAEVGTTGARNGRGYASGYCRACRRLAWSRYNAKSRKRAP